MRVALRKHPQRQWWHGKRIIIRGTPLRGIVVEEMDKVCLVYRDDTMQPILVREKDLEIL
jgi:hypothetical protein